MPRGMARTPLLLEGLSRNELLTRAEELQQENASILRDNADLRRQIDAYFNKEGYDPFDMSLVLRERALSAESQLQQSQQRYEQVSAEYEGLKEDLDSTKEAKRQSDKAYREAMATISRMEQEVQFYRKQFVDAMQARDRGSGEVERLKAENSNLAELRSKCQAEMKAERQAHAEVKRRLQICEAELAVVQQQTNRKAKNPFSDAHTEVHTEDVDRANVQNGSNEAGGPVVESAAYSEDHPVEGRADACDEQDSSCSWQWHGSERIKVSDTSSPTKDRTPPSSDGREACEESVASG